jgi:hypothetical protein
MSVRIQHVSLLTPPGRQAGVLAFYRLYHD